MVSNHMYVQTEVLHSGLNNEARWKLVQSFNNPTNPIKVLILMYNVGAQGVNLDPCCNRILVATGAINASLEIQAWGRGIRVSMLLPYRSETDNITSCVLPRCPKYMRSWSFDAECSIHATRLETRVRWIRR